MNVECQEAWILGQEQEEYQKDEKTEMYENNETTRKRIKHVKYETQYDKMTKEPVGRLVITLGIPTTISMLVTNIYNMVDTMFVGKLGTSASAAVGIIFGFMSILQAFGFLFGQGAGSIISRRLGNKDEESASIVASTSFFSSLFLGALIGILELSSIRRWFI